MRNSRETIYNALATEIQKILPTLLSVSRVYRAHNDYADAQLPAGCLDEKEEDADPSEEGALPLYKLNVDLWLYFLAPQLSQTPGAEEVIPMTVVNNALDALENGPLSNPPQSGLTYNTLGGLVQWVRIQGKIQKVAGTANGNVPVSVAKIPLIIFTT